MTVIAWDGKTLAADKLACSGNTKSTVTKIWRHGGCLVGVTGDLTIGMEVLAWWKAGASPETFPAANRDPEKGAGLIVVEPTGRVMKYESSPMPYQAEGAFVAFGCGDESALIAMACGKTAKEAVEIVCRFNTGCGNGVDALELQ